MPQEAKRTSSSVDPPPLPRSVAISRADSTWFNFLGDWGVKARLRCHTDNNPFSKLEYLHIRVRPLLPQS